MKDPRNREFTPKHEEMLLNKLANAKTQNRRAYYQERLESVRAHRPHPQEPKAWVLRYYENQDYYFGGHDSKMVLRHKTQEFETRLDVENALKSNPQYEIIEIY